MPHTRLIGIKCIDSLYLCFFFLRQGLTGLELDSFYLKQTWKVNLQQIEQFSYGSQLGRGRARILNSDNLAPKLVLVITVFAMHPE
jgi:hypothetical protein